MAGKVPLTIYPQISNIVAIQECIADACLRRDLDAAFCGFVCDPLVTVTVADAKKLFDEMVDNTAEYLTEYKR